MKSYVQGLITGGVFVFAFMVLIGASSNDGEVGRYQISTAISAGELRSNVYEAIIDTKTGDITRYKTPASKYKK